jgi:lipid-A-disaccharide synthase-like uncharacterized protein
MKYSDLTLAKIRLYYASNYLYSKGKSHVQIVSLLTYKGFDKELVIEIADQAMVDLWRKVFNQAQELIAAGKTYDEVLEEVSGIIPDHEVTHFIIDSWYRIQTLYIDNLIESRSNIDEGFTYFAISFLGLIAVIYFNASLPVKAIWTISTIGTLMKLIYGLLQKKDSSKLEEILRKDYAMFGELI